MRSYQFTPKQKALAIDYHGGQSSMLYAVASTGALTIGSEGFRDGRTDEEWLCDLMFYLMMEVEHTDFAQEDEVEGERLLNELNKWLEQNSYED